MLKLIGALLCVLASLKTGISIYRETESRLECLQELASLLETIHCELSTSLMPIPEIMRTAAERTSGFAGGFAKLVYTKTNNLKSSCFETLWRDSCREKLSVLKNEDMLCLERLGCVLGRAAIEEQLSAVSAVRARLEWSAGEIEKSMPTLKKTAVGLSLSLGLAVSILLI